MSVLRSVQLGLLTILLGAAACAGAKDSREWNLGGMVEISAEGKVESLELFNTQELSAELLALVQAAARDWNFNTAAVTGEPARLRTTVRTRVSLSEGADGPQVEVEPLAFGEPVRSDAAVPSYPLEGLRQRHNARVLMALWVDSEGKVVEAEPLRGELRGRLDRRESLRQALEPFVAANRHYMLQGQFVGIDPESEGKLILEEITFTMTDSPRPPPRQTPEWKGRVVDYDHPRLPLGSERREQALADFASRSALGGAVTVVEPPEG